MKTKYKHIYFERAKGWKDRWFCRNNKSDFVLAHISWYAPWRCYCSETMSNSAVFSADCHRDIADFLEQLNRERKG